MSLRKNWNYVQNEMIIIFCYSKKWFEVQNEKKPNSWNYFKKHLIVGKISLKCILRVTLFVEFIGNNIWAVSAARPAQHSTGQCPIFA